MPESKKSLRRHLDHAEMLWRDENRAKQVAQRERKDAEYVAARLAIKVGIYDAYLLNDSNDPFPATFAVSALADDLRAEDEGARRAERLEPFKGGA